MMPATQCLIFTSQILFQMCKEALKRSADFLTPASSLTVVNIVQQLLQSVNSNSPPLALLQ